MLYAVAGGVGLLCSLFAAYIMHDQKVSKGQTLFTSIFFGTLIFCTVAF